MENLTQEMLLQVASASDAYIEFLYFQTLFEGFFVTMSLLGTLGVIVYLFKKLEL